MRRFINQFRRKYGPETQSSVSANAFNTDFSSFNSLSPSENGTTDSTSPGDDSFHISTDSDDDNIECDIGIQADQAVLCQAKQVHDLVLGKTDALLVKKFLTTSDAPHLDTKALIQKNDEVAKIVDLHVSTTPTEQMKDQFSVLYVPGFLKTFLPISNHQRFNSLKVSSGIFKNSIDFFLKKKDSPFAVMNRRTK